MLVARVTGVADRDAAAALTNVELFIERAVLPPPEDDEFYVADLVGMAAVDGEGRVIGQVVDVPNYGGGDLIEIRPTPGGETLIYAFTRAVVPTIDVEARRVTLVPPDEIEGADDETA